MASTGGKSLAARGRTDLKAKEEGEEWLRKGLELQNAAYDDEWMALVDANSTSANPTGPIAQLQTASIYVERIREGSDPESVAACLGMTSEDREFAHSISYFVPSAFDLIQADEERRQSIIKKHEARLREAFQCFETGLSLDPSNSELNCKLADAYQCGLGVPEDDGAALPPYQKAAALGNSAAKSILGRRMPLRFDLEEGYKA